MTERSERPSLFTRYDIQIETRQQARRQVSTDALLQRIAGFVADGDEDNVESSVQGPSPSGTPWS